MSDLFKKTMLAGLGVLTLSKEKAEEIADDLVKQGEIAKNEKAEFIKNLTAQIDKSSNEAKNKIKKEVEKTLQSLNIPTRKELNKITEKLNTLAGKLEEVNK